MPNILIAEDSEINQKLIAHLFHRMGYQFTIVDDGAKAVAAAREAKYDFIFMDILMPVKTGLQAAKEIVAQYPSGTCPIIVALTANSEEADRQDCIEAGMQEFLTKPIQMSDVKCLIDKYSKSN